MKPSMLAAMVVLIAAAATAQQKESAPSESGSIQQPSDRPAASINYGSRGGSTLSPMIAYGSFSVGGEERFGPMVALQFSPGRTSMPAVDYFAGVLFQTGKSGNVDPKDYVPVASYFAPYYSPYSNYRNDYAYQMPRFSIGLAFIGADVTFYMLQGDVRPYLGLGGSLVFWPYANQLDGTVAPDARAGLQVHLSNSFSGFAEVRRMVGVPNLFGLDEPKFGGVTSAAIGLSFAPHLR